MKFTLLRRSCKEAAALLVAREDRALSLPDTMALRLHLMACKACPQFENQILTMRQAMARWRQTSDESGNKRDSNRP
ncbi:MAG: zf-HC2 domain-containing protein [Pseudomonadota bacterium]|uniref:zf-HC2 domain-containing protein n=1 Tax=Polaromonas sp. TaxID=1869339 RepID=UPI001832E292|nr:zf-HC2 domain-containing protein [Polaromonas sp.]MBA3594641.1 zf-HC2 domain-containing protein [Polaromonas sp.]MDQ3271991.1 zf-HC2 domain-containing protein [Pseudomonadota bacterium]